MEFDPTQQRAIEQCSDPDRRIVAVTGVAGTGKTSIIRAAYNNIIQQLGIETHEEAAKHIALCAPTGKAARRMREATGIPAFTMHKLLEYTHPGDPDPKTGEPKFYSYPRRDRENRLEQKWIFADEYAMVTHALHRSLIDALPHGGRIRAFGDINQLPPIEEKTSNPDMPSPFETMLTKFRGITLENIYRQGEGSGIVLAGDRIRKGRVPMKAEDFIMTFTQKPQDELLRLVEDYLSRGIDFSKIENQIISPKKKSWIGTWKLNDIIQNFFRHEVSGWLELERHEWATDMIRVHEGDKIIFTKNNYGLKVMNGEVGVITYLDDCAGVFTVDPG